MHFTVIRIAASIVSPKKTRNVAMKRIGGLQASFGRLTQTKPGSFVVQFSTPNKRKSHLTVGDLK